MHLTWYLARASGMVALVLVTVAVVWGLLFGTRVLQGRPTPKWLLDMHRFLGGLSVTFTVIHVAALVADSYVHFGPAEILVPFASAWRPGAVALGIVAGYLILAVQATSLMMKRLPRRLWKWVHLTSYAAFWLAIVHGARSGADAGNTAYGIGVAGAVVIVTFLTAYRVLTGRKSRRPRTPQRAAAAPVALDPA